MQRYFWYAARRRGVDVQRFVQDISPIACATSNHFLYEYTEILKMIADKKGMPSFSKRNFALDFTGKGFDYLKEVKSDYLILDMGCCRYDCYNFFNGGILTKMHNDQKMQVQYFKEIFEMLGIKESYSIISEDAILEEMMDECLPIYLDRIQEVYPIDKIIFVETKIAELRISKEGKLEESPYIQLLQKWRNRINYANELAQVHLKGCHIIEFPKGVLADEQHKWGPGGLHYIKEYYDYAFQCMQIIFRKYKLEDEKKYLGEIKERCEQEIDNRFHFSLQKALHNNQQLNHVNDRLMKYCDYFRMLLLNPERLDYALKYLRDHAYHKCAIYGLSQIGIFWCDYLENEGFDIKFVVEDGGQLLYKNHILRFKRRQNEYPEVDVIVVADVVWASSIKEALKVNMRADVIDIYELIGI